VLEIATFYTMFNLEPVGRFHVQLCGTTPCELRGAKDLKKVCHDKIGEQHHVTEDGALSWIEVECLGACVNAPMAQINYDFYEDLTPESFSKILDEMKAGRVPEPGPQIDRQLSAPVGGPTTLTDPSLYPLAKKQAKDGGAREKEPALHDDVAKKPTEAASQQESPIPTPPADDASGKGRKGKSTKK